MTVLLTLALAAMIVDARMRSAIAAYVLFTIGALIMSYPRDGGAVALGIFFVLASVKLIVGPGALLWLAKTQRLRDDLSPSFPLGVRLIVVVAALWLAHQGSQLPALASFHGAALALYALATSACIVIAHRSLIAHVIGLLVLGSAVTLAAAVVAPGLPWGAEAADTFDAVLATLVGVSIARAIAQHDAELNARSLRELRG